MQKQDSLIRAGLLASLAVPMDSLFNQEEKDIFFPLRKMKDITSRPVQKRTYLHLEGEQLKARLATKRQRKARRQTRLHLK